MRIAVISVAVYLVLALGCVSHGASYTSDQTGDYDADATWSESGNPGGGSVADTVTINSPHTVTITVANDASTDTVTVHTGGKLKGAQLVADVFSGATIWMQGGTLEYWSGNATRTVGGDVLIQTNSTLRLRPTSGTSQGNFGTLAFEEGTAAGGYVLNVIKSGATPTAKFTGVTLDYDATVDTEAILEISDVTLAPTATLTKMGTDRLVVSGADSSGVEGAFDFQDGILEAQVARAFGTNTLTVGPGCTLTAGQMLVDAFQGLPINLNGGTLRWDAGNQEKDAGGDVLVQANSTLHLVPTLGSIGNFGTLAFEESTTAGGYVLNVTKSGSTPKATFTGVTLDHDATVNIEATLQISDVTLDPAATLTKTGTGRLIVSGANSSGVEGTFDFQDGVMEAQVARAFGTNALTVGPGCTLTAKMMLTDAFQGLPINLNGGTLRWNLGNANNAPGGNVRVQADSDIDLLETQTKDIRAPFGTLTFDDKGLAGGHVLSVGNSSTRGGYTDGGVYRRHHRLRRHRERRRREHRSESDQYHT